MTFKILMTARDAAAALHLIEIARAASKRADVVLEIATQAPATQYFRSAGIATHHIDLPATKNVHSEEGKALLTEASRLIRDIAPDAVLCGLSTPFDAGIDEALTARFRGPKFVMQDFWGETNLSFGEPADLYFALDEEGVRLTEERHGLRAKAIGSPRHSAYASLDLGAIRRLERDRLNIREDVTVLGFFGQALHSIEGYWRTLQAWETAALSQPGPCLALYRPHPRESEEEALATIELLRKGGLKCIVSDAADVEHAILACDVVCSAFSNCTYDAAYLNYFSKDPLATPVSLIFEQGVISYFRRMVKLKEFPYLKAGLVKAVRKPEDLSSALADAASPAGKARYWEQARRLANPTDASDRVLSEILCWQDNHIGVLQD